jgi:hypothetical protein
VQGRDSSLEVEEGSDAWALVSARRGGGQRNRLGR